MKKSLIVLVAFLVLVSPLSAKMITNNKVLSWSTSAGQKGAMKIVAVKGNYFEVEQTNDRNKSAGTIKLYGAVVDNGRKMVLINTGNWKEIWEGSISSNKITGKLLAGSAKYTFNITEQIAAAPSAAFTPGVYQGVHRHWTDKVIFSSNGTFKRAVNNDPGKWTFDGTKLILKWAKWPAETLVQTSPGKFSCKSYKFTLSATTSASNVSSSAPTEPFVKGQTLKWTTSARQNGTFLVTSVSGTKFTINQINFKNKRAGTTKLDGEVKGGKIYIYNRRWRETWIGTYRSGKVTGKINKRYSFAITK